MDDVQRDWARRTVAANEVDGDSRGRDSLFLTALLRLEDEASPREVRIRNLSEGGLMAETDRDVAIGGVAILELRGIGEVTGKIAWCTQGRIGIALDRPIDPKLARRQVGGGTQTPFYARSAPR